MGAQVIIVLQEESFRSSIPYYITNVLEGAYLLIAFIFVTVMLVFHCYIASQNITTNEYCKDMWKTISGNPFKKYIDVNI